jgi:hypothetical protein
VSTTSEPDRPTLPVPLPTPSMVVTPPPFLPTLLTLSASASVTDLP